MTWTGVAAPAFAATPAKNAAPAKTKMLSRNELRACLAQQDQNKAEDAEFIRERDAIAAETAEIGRSRDALTARLATVDRTSAEAVAAYNEAAHARDGKVEAHDARVTAFNARVNTAQEARVAERANCADRRYLADDETDLRKAGKGASGK